MKRFYDTRGPGPKRTKHKPNPQHYKSPEGNAFLVISDKQHKIKILLDRGLNIYLLNQNMGRTLKVPSQRRENPLKITAFNGEGSSTGGKYDSHSILLEIGTKGDTTIVSCDITEAGKYDIIIPFGWWAYKYRVKKY